MKPTIKLAEATTPDGRKLVLSQHDRDYYISVNQCQLMTSREHESELELARLARLPAWAAVACEDDAIPRY